MVDYLWRRRGQHADARGGGGSGGTINEDPDSHWADSGGAWLDAVEEELTRLEMTITHSFANSVDLDRANTADPQGIGGRTKPPDRPGDPPSG